MSGPYCAACGQRSLDLERPLRELAGEALGALVAFDARILRTLWPLVSRPGWLTLEYLAGRRVRFVHPLKLYLAFSLLLFLALGLSGYPLIRLAGDDGGALTAGGVVSTQIQRQGPAADAAAAPSALDAVVGPLLELLESDPERLNRVFTDRLAKSVIVLVPVFALLVRLLYRRRTYVAQLVFSLHLHSFAFFALVVGLGLDLALGSAQDSRPGNGLAVLAVMAYTFIALRRVGGRGRLATAGKMAALGIGYLLALLVTMFATLALTAVTV